MKKIPVAIVVVLVVALFATACGSDDDATVTSQEPTSTTPGAEESNVDDSEESPMALTRLWVGPQLVDCVGSAPQKCMLVRDAEDGQAEYFYDTIEGFTHVAGTTSVIDVEVTEIADPPADGSSLRYRLVEIVEENSEQAADRLEGTAWTLLGFRDGDLFDPVTDGVEITIAFDGDQVNGSAGCNNYMGSAVIDGDAVSFGPLAATKKLCVPEVMAFEDRYLPILESVETAELTFDDRLVLAPATGLTLVFAPA